MSYILTEAELEYHYGTELSHYGVKGMRWGKSGVKSGPSRKELRGMDKATRSADKLQARKASDRNDASIMKARAGLEGKAQAYKSAKGQYKIEKKQIGKVAARKALDKPREDFDKAWEKANEPTRKEANKQLIVAMVGAVGYVAINALANS